MPVVIAAAALYAGAITVTQFVLFVVTTAYAADQKSRARAKAKQQFNDSLRDRLVALPTVDGRRSRVYGRARNVDGILYKATFGANNARYVIVYALAGHEVDGIEQVYFGDNQPVTIDAGTGQVLTAPWAGGRLVDRAASITLSGGAGFVDLPEPPQGPVRIGRLTPTGSRFGFSWSEINGGSIAVAGNRVTVSGAGGSSGAFDVKYQALQAEGQSRAFVTRFTGAPGQNVGAFLAGFGVPGMTTAHKFEGIACLVCVFDYDEDAFATGLPSVSAVIRGAKVLDPRDGVTRWTENPALIARDWAVNAQGGGALPEEVDAASFIAAANACDVQHRFLSVGSTGPVQTWRPMYTCGIVARTDGDPTATLAAIVESMAGDWAWCGGQLRVRAGAYSAPVADITEDWISSNGAIDIVSTAARTELVNTITATIADAAYHYLSAPQPRLRVGAYVDKDGGEYPLDLTLEAVTDADHAGHIQGVMLRQRRQALTVQLTCNNRAYPLQVFDTARLTLPAFGWAAKPFEVMAWQFSPQGGIRLTLRETDASIYTPDAEFTRSDPAPNTALPDPWDVPSITGLAATSGNAELLRQADGTVLTRLRVSWAAVADEAVRVGGAVEVAVTPWNGTEADRRIVRAEGDATHVHVTGVQDSMVYVVSARARNGLVAGPWSPIIAHQVLGKSAPPSDVAAFTATPAPGGLRLAWTACPDADYALTELRAGTSWASATPIWRGAGNAYEWAAAVGSYTVLARHEDSSGNLSSAVASVNGTALNTVQVGGRNILPGASNGSGWSASGFSAGEFWRTAAAVGETDYIFSPYITLPGGIEVTLSFESQQDGPVSGQPEWFLLPDNYSVLGLYRADYPASTTWIKNTFTFTTPAGWGSGASVRLRIDHNGSPGGAPRSYRAKRIKLEVGNTATDWTPPVEDVDASVAAAAQAAATAQSTANTASSNASSALSTLATMRSNGYLDAAEKPALIRQWQAVNDERAGIVARANAFGITSERDSYTAAWDALASYLSGLSPGWSDTTQDTPITPAVDQSTWAGLYSTRQALLNRIAQVAGERASWAGVTGPGRPQDGATVGAPAGTYVGGILAEAVESVSGAQAKADAAAAAAQSAAQAYAAAQAAAADTAARAYADGIVDAEEARAIADATAKANAARLAAEAAAAADATAKANLAATTALWAGIPDVNVTTGQIAADAATVVLTSYLAGPVASFNDA